MKVQVIGIDDHGHHYEALKFWCVGCQLLLSPDDPEHGGLHMLPISGDANGRATWTFNGDLDKPTLAPSIGTRTHKGYCHSFMRDGMFQYLTDCDHPLAGQTVPVPDLPEWAVKMA